MRKFRWLLLNVIFSICLYMGFIEHYEGAYNVAMFIAWFSILLSPILLTQTAREHLQSEGLAMPISVNAIVDLCVVLTFTWFGNWLTAALYLIYVFILIGAHGAAFKVETEA